MSLAIRLASVPARSSRDCRRHWAGFPCVNCGCWPQACAVISMPDLARDGSRIECPRSAELEARLGKAGKNNAVPTLWVTAFVHLAMGRLWSWQLGPGTPAEQIHLFRLLNTLSAEAPIVCDAAYMGFDLVRAIVGSSRSFLFCMSSKVHLYTLEKATLKTWSEGPVLYWPQCAQADGQAPIHCRLIRIPAKGKTKRDVWLLADVLDPARLSLASAAKFYRWRWRSKDMFRTYKRTIDKLKLLSRTAQLVHREAESSLLATQILLAQADLALRPETSASGESVISPRKVLIEIRREMEATAKRRGQSPGKRLEGCRADDRKQTRPKASRPWPRRKSHKPPVIHTLSEEQNVLLNQHFDAAG